MYKEMGAIASAARMLRLERVQAIAASSITFLSAHVPDTSA